MGFQKKCRIAWKIFKEQGPVGFVKTARMIRLQKKYPLEFYHLWMEQSESEEVGEMPDYAPLVSVVVPVYNVAKELLIACIESVKAQAYKNWELILVDDASTMEETKEVLSRYEKEGREGKDASRIRVYFRKENGHISRATNDGFANAKGEFLALLDCDDTISRNALYEMVKKVNEDPEYDYIYSDEDKMTPEGVRHLPFFKPDWSPDTFLSLMYTCHFSMFRKCLVDELGGMRVGFEGAQDYDFVLRFTEKARKIGHVPKILYHWMQRPESTAAGLSAKPYVLEAMKRAKEEALKRRGIRAKVIFQEAQEQFRIDYEVPQDVKISIIIPSKDHVELVRQCVDSIREVTAEDAPAYEIIVVDNGSLEAQKSQYEEYLKAQGAAYVYEPEEFNFSRMCNRGAEKASGNVLLFLNDDTQVKSPDWLTRMAGQAVQKHTGAVGAKLLYPKTGKIQHAGVVNLPVGPSHMLMTYTDERDYYYGRNTLTYNFLAVTGACLMVRKEVFREVHGFDESFPVAYNDVDLCFRIFKAGYYNVQRNDAVLVHHESVSRGNDELDAGKMERLFRERKHLYERNPGYEGYDPFYNPNLAPDKPDYSFYVVTQKEK